MIHQLRIYEIFGATRTAFHDRFRDHASRIMRRHGFDIRAMWEARQDDRLEFVYLLGWPDEAAMRRAWAGFMGDAEWQEIRRETNARQGPLVGAIQDRTLTPVPYATPAG